MRLPHWFGETVTACDTTLGRLPSLLPVFERRALGRNRFRDAIVRNVPGYHEPLTVGMVSKRYLLVQHEEAIGAVSAELKRAGIDPGAIPVQLQISEYGTRMALRATLPDEFAFDAADGHRMALTFECLNSVDKTVPLFAAVGWFRFICSNGLIVGTTCARVGQRHSPALRIDEFSAVLAAGVESAMQDREAFLAWRSTPINDDRLAWWVDGPVAEAWGPAGTRPNAPVDRPAGAARGRPGTCIDALTQRENLRTAPLRDDADLSACARPRTMASSSSEMQARARVDADVTSRRPS